MYDRILLPLDGSTIAERAIPHVQEIAKRFGSEVHLVQAVPVFAQVLAETIPGDATGAAVDVSMDVARQRVEAETMAAQRYLATMAEQLQREGIKTRTDVLEGAPGTAILEYARRSEASLIAMSTHGRGGLGRLVFGSVADEILRNAGVPVLIVRATS